MEKTDKNIYLYFGDSLFKKLHNFELKQPEHSIKSVKLKVIDCVKFAPEADINDMFLGWSFIIFKSGKNMLNYKVLFKLKMSAISS